MKLQGPPPPQILNRSDCNKKGNDNDEGNHECIIQTFQLGLFAQDHVAIVSKKQRQAKTLAGQNAADTSTPNLLG